MTNAPVVSFEPLKFGACALPAGHPDYADYLIRVAFRPQHRQWVIFHAGPRGGHGGMYLGTEGWSPDEHLFDDLDTARSLTMDAALTLTVHGRTVGDVIAADRSAVVR